MSGGRDVSLMIFITSMSGTKSLKSFAYRISRFRGASGLRLAFDAAQRNGKFDHIWYQRSEGSCSRGKEKERNIPLPKDSES